MSLQRSPKKSQQQSLPPLQQSQPSLQQNQPAEEQVRTPNTAKALPASMSQANTSAHKSSPANVENVADLKRDFARKMEEMSNEFKRQMHAMQSMMTVNCQQMQNSITTSINSIRTEIKSSQVSNIEYSAQNPHLPLTNSSHSSQSPSNRSPLNQNASGSTISNHTSANQSSFNIRQKKIYPLPLFTGSPEEWQTFYEAFNSTTMEFEYTNLHNIMRLREALKGRALETVESLLNHSNNVQAIMETLEEMFGRPEQLIKSQIEKVKSIAPVTEGNMTELITFANRITNMATFLKNAKGEHHLSNPSLLSELVVKLPSARRMQWAEKCLLLERQPTITDFSNWLTALRRLANVVLDSLPSTSETATKIYAKSQKTPSSSHAPSANPFKRACVSVAQPKCAVCDGECKHLSLCKQFLQMHHNARWEKIKQLGACFSCLKIGHQTNRCFSRKRCNVENCQRSHHPLLHTTEAAAISSRNTIHHNQTRHNNQPTTNTTQTRTLHQNAATDINPHGPERNDYVQHAPTQHDGRRSCHADCSNNNILFQIIPIKIYAAGREYLTHAFVDDGANVSMIDDEFARTLNIHGTPDNLQIQWLNEKTTCQETERVNITISGVGEFVDKYELSNVYTVNGMELPYQSVNSGELLSYGHDHLTGLPSIVLNNIQPKIVLSLAHAYLTVPLEIPKSSPSMGTIATKTRLGWMIYGPMQREDFPVKRVMFMRKHEKLDCKMMNELNKTMKNYFDLENFGVKLDCEPILSKDDERALLILKQTTKRIGNKFECGLLWRTNFSSFPDSYPMALKRLENLEKKMAREPEYTEQYRTKMEDYVKKGYAIKLSEEEAKKTTNKTFYLPHFGVKHPGKKGIRIVFDAAAEVQNCSLNKFLLNGPDINQPLINILFKFRQAPIGVCGDIQEMFHQVDIIKEDRQSQRFLWRNGNPKDPVSIYEMRSMIFGAACSPTIAQYVKNINAEEFRHKYPEAVEAITERHYVDDYVDSFQTEDEAKRVVAEVIRIHQAGGFHLRNFRSNSHAILSSFGNPGDVNKCGEFQSEGKILGMQWLSKTDVFVFIFDFVRIDKNLLNFNKRPTKRELLAITMSVFDPFGFLADFMVTAKLIMQKTWNAGIQWDDQLPENLFIRWKSWMEQLDNVKTSEVPRCYFKNFETAVVDLHVFCDASEEALATVAYWRGVSDDMVHIAFVSGKSSCAPTRYHTIPKLELQAAVMGVRLKNTIVRTHTINVRKVILWTDSHTVVRWIRSDHRQYKPYVANRVSEILETTTISDWRWCPGINNPADEATRSKYPTIYKPNGRWLKGPDFLLQGESEWPNEDMISSCNDQSEEELRNKHRALFVKKICEIIPMIDRFSNYSRLKRCMAWIIRYKDNLKRKVKKEALVLEELSADEELKAEIHICGAVQKQVFANEIADILAKGYVSKDSHIVTLNPQWDCGLMRAGGRLIYASALPMDMRNPIILPKNNILTRLIASYFHRKFHHINTATVMAEIKRRFWIPSLRQLLKGVQSSCQACRLRLATPRTPQMGNLPLDRVSPFMRPFSYTGLDFFGPVTVTIRRQKEKRWVALFTCLSTRAVHLEVAADLSSDACVVCIRNFINRRGVPIQIRSDNGTNFVGIPKELRNAVGFLDQDKMRAGLSPLGIKWIFNTPYNPSEGGAWERLVQSVKKALYAMLKEHFPRLETLQSFLIEAENIINSRPLTHLPVTPDEPEPLTPNHFILGCANSTQTPAPFEARQSCSRKQWRVIQNMKNGMWKQWIREYLPDLTRRTKWCLPVNPLSIGSLVLICDSESPRSRWKRGRVVKFYTGKDGIARSADVSTSSGIFKRPISKLAVIDVTTGSGEASPLSVHGGGNVGN